MQILVENLSDLGRKIKVSIPYSNINDMIATKIKKSSKEIKLNGFRPGHVPVKLIEQKYGASFRQETISEIMDSALNQAITENKLSPIGDIKLEDFVDDEKGFPDQGLKCEFVLEIYPEVDFNDFSGLEIKTPVVNLTEQDLDAGLLAVRKKMAKKITVDRPAVSGDVVIVDFNGSIEGKEFPGGFAEDFSIEIGSKLIIDGFEEGLVGTSAGEVKQLDLIFPDDYPEKSLAGKPVRFTINIKKVQENQLPEIDEEFAKALNIKDGDVTAVRSKILSNMENHVKSLTEEKERTLLIDLLLTNYPITLPQSLVDKEENRLRYAFKKNYQDQGIMVKDLNEKAVEEIKKQAIKNIHLSLLIRSVVKNYDLKLDEKLLQNQLQEIDMLFGNAKNLNSNYKNIRNNLKNSIVDSSITELALKFVISKINKLEEPYTFDQLAKKD